MCERLMDVPADELDDGAVFEAGVCCAGIPSLIYQLHNMILVGELFAHQTGALDCGRVLNTHSCNTYGHRYQGVNKKCFYMLKISVFLLIHLTTFMNMTNFSQLGHEPTRKLLAWK